jgi:hypothetical protein
MPPSGRGTPGQHRPENLIEIRTELGIGQLRGPGQHPDHQPTGSWQPLQPITQQLAQPAPHQIPRNGVTDRSGDYKAHLRRTGFTTRLRLNALKLHGLLAMEQVGNQHPALGSAASTNCCGEFSPPPHSACGR